MLQEKRPPCAKSSFKRITYYALNLGSATPCSSAGLEQSEYDGQDISEAHVSSEGVTSQIPL